MGGQVTDTPDMDHPDWKRGYDAGRSRFKISELSPGDASNTNFAEGYVTAMEEMAFEKEVQTGYGKGG